MRVNLRGIERGDLLAVEHQFSLFKDLFHLEILEIIHDDQVCQVAGGDGAPVIEQEVAGRVMAGSLDGDDRVDAVAVDGLADDIVDMALGKEIIGVPVVAAEHAALMVFPVEQRRQRLEIPGGSALTDHDKLAPLELPQRVVQVGALVVGVDTGGDIGIQLLAGQARGMAVDLFMMCLGGDDLFDDLLIASDDADVIHHLRQALDAGIVIEHVDGPVVQRGSGFVHRRGRDAGGQHEPHIHR